MIKISKVSTIILPNFCAQLVNAVALPSVVVPFKRLNYSDVISGGTQETLPAFITNGQEKSEIYISKYQNVVVNDRAYSLPLKCPAVMIDFDTAIAACANKGAGWHLTTNALFSSIGLWCGKNGTNPHGNNNFGQDINNPLEKGSPCGSRGALGEVLTTAAGSGPVNWYHNHKLTGISDLNGNVAEYVSGLRLFDGEIQVIPYGNAMRFDCNMGVNSTLWKAIRADGSFVAPGTNGALKYNYADGKLVLNAETIPLIAKALVIATEIDGDSGMISGEWLAVRGGDWSSGEKAGVLALDFKERGQQYMSVGFRSAYYEK